VIYFLLFIPIAILLVAFQAAVLNPLTVAGGPLDILLVSLVLLTLYGSLEMALIGVIIMAPLVDALAGMPLGVSIIPMTSVVLLAYWGGKTIFGARLGWPVLVVFAGTFIAGLITIAELAILGWNMPWNELIVRTLIPSAILNTIAVTIIYLPIIMLNERRELHL
jgi:cell shape-determining protein MreD